MPGIYRIYRIATGESYIGTSKDISRRCWDHPHRKSRLRLAIDEFGRNAFFVEPLFIALNDTDLREEEARLIEDYDAVQHGYNIQARQADGSLGDKFAATIRAARSHPLQREAARDHMLNRWETDRDEILRSMGTPEARDKHREALKEIGSRPERKLQLSNAMKRRHEDPEYRAALPALLDKARQSEKRKTSMQRILAARNRSDEMKNRTAQRTKMLHEDPEWHAQWLAKITEANKRPDRGEKIRLARTGTIAITNGIEQRHIPRDSPIPVGWRRGSKRSKLPGRN